MSIDGEILNSRPVKALCDMYAAEYAAPSAVPGREPVPSVLNALGACAGFAAQVAVWHELILPRKRNPGDYLVYATTKSNEVFFFGEAINQFLLSTGPDRLSFLSLAAGPLSNASELPDIGELLGHVTRSIGSASFGQPRLPPSVDLSELPRAALSRTWRKAVSILLESRHAEWPALLGAAANNIVTSNRRFLAPPGAIKVLLEAAAPMSKLNPLTVDGSGVPPPTLTNWSMRAYKPENNRDIVTEVRAAMPAMPSRISARPHIVSRPRIAFANLAGASCAQIAAQDRADVGRLFGDNVEPATSSVKACDVLFLYCEFEPSGSIIGQQSSLRDLIRTSGASVAIVASQVPENVVKSAGFQKAVGRGANPPVNLVITNNRNGETFGRFFKSLFQQMLMGVPMPMAWVKLAPQGLQQSQDIPGTICLMEAGQVIFGGGA
jgi:hypothetical protein